MGVVAVSMAIPKHVFKILFPAHHPQLVHCEIATYVQCQSMYMHTHERTNAYTHVHKHGHTHTHTHTHKLTIRAENTYSISVCIAVEIGTTIVVAVSDTAFSSTTREVCNTGVE